MSPGAAGNEEIRVIPIDRLDLRLEPRAWTWAEENRAAVEAHFDKMRVARPAMWNGRVLLLHRYAVEAATLRGAYLETDFASFLYWRDAGFPDRSIRNCFAMGALRAADGAFLLGRMAKHTSNAGKIYFPSGTPVPGDVLVDRSVDLAGSVRRELLEETGLVSTELTVGLQWTAVFAGARIALIRPLTAREDAETVRARIRVHLAAAVQPELADMVVVRARADFSAAMPDFVLAYLETALA